MSKSQTASLCNVYETSDWHVQLDRLDGSEEKYFLKITGHVDLPSPGYIISWRMGITDRARPPGQRIILKAVEPDNISMQVITRKDVVFEQEVPFSEYSHISIYCGDRLLERIEDIQASN
ncbi:MAG: hypothetical protein ACRBCS_15100 [Cellvibrionaceae bacterium]